MAHRPKRCVNSPSTVLQPRSPSPTHTPIQPSIARPSVPLVHPALFPSSFHPPMPRALAQALSCGQGFPGGVPSARQALSLPRWPGHSHLHGAVPHRILFPLHLASPRPANSSAPGGHPSLLNAHHRASPRQGAGPPWGHTHRICLGGARLILTTALGKRQICPVFPSLGGEMPVCTRV